MSAKTTRRAVLAGSAAVAAATPLATVAVAMTAPVCPEGFEVIERAGEIWFQQMDGPDAPFFDTFKE